MTALRWRPRLATAAALLIAAACPANGPTDRHGGASDLTIPPGLRRPLALPSIEPGEPCPFSEAVHLPGLPAEAGLGRGPVYPVSPAMPRLVNLFRTRFAGRSGLWTAEILLVSERGYRGPALVRGGGLDRPAPVRFLLHGKQRDALLLPAREWRLEVQRPDVWPAGRVRLPEGWRVTSAIVAIGGHGCYALQIDTLDGSSRIVFAAMPQPAGRSYSMS